MCQALYDLFKDQLEQKAREMAEEKAVQMAEQKVAKMSADIFSDGETATQVSLIAKKIKKGKPLSVIAAELEETEEVILPLYKRVSAQLALQA